MIIETNNGKLFEMEFQHNIVTEQQKYEEKKFMKGDSLDKKYAKTFPKSSTTVKLFEVSDYRKLPFKKIFVDFAEAYCSSKDNFSKSFGRKTAIKKLLKKIDMKKEDRIRVWEEYFDEHKF